MMCAMVLLEEFSGEIEKLPAGGPLASGDSAPDGASQLQGPASPEAWEQGYKAGWEDALRNEVEEQKRIGAEFARNLQELSFTYFEARAEVIASLQPLVGQMVEALFPAVLSEALAATLLEELRELLGGEEEGVELVLSPSAREVIAARLGDELPPSVRLIEEETLAEGQAYLRVAHRERRIDLAAALEAMRVAAAAYFGEMRKERAVNE